MYVRIHARMTSHLKEALIHNLLGSLVCLAYFLSMGVYTTRHWQTSGRLLHELN